MASSSNDLSTNDEREEREQSPLDSKGKWKYESLWRDYHERNKESANDWDDDDDWDHDSYWANYHGKSLQINNEGTTDGLSEMGNKESSNADEDQRSTPLFQQELEEEPVGEVEVMEGMEGPDGGDNVTSVTSSDEEEKLSTAPVATPRLRSARLKKLKREASELLKEIDERERKAQRRRQKANARRLRIAPVGNKKGKTANKTKKDKENSERTCEKCDKVFPKRHYYRIHYRDTHQTHFKRCEICGISYANQKALKAHLQKLNKKGECVHKVSGHQGFQCLHCNFRAARRKLVQTHMQHCQYDVFTKSKEEMRDAATALDGWVMVLELRWLQYRWQAVVESFCVPCPALG
ncbi:unnamed protein product [Orchesella dallaii]|uniref:C2H2-type domain-containing protein n=1 Tax=Orchesella dallaii TaxID=48710 RepID=A0ABP1QCG6_9HEXA